MDLIAKNTFEYQNRNVVSLKKLQNVPQSSNYTFRCFIPSCALFDIQQFATSLRRSHQISILAILGPSSRSQSDQILNVFVYLCTLLCFTQNVPTLGPPLMTAEDFDTL